MSPLRGQGQAEDILRELRSKGDPAGLKDLARYGIRNDRALGGIRMSDLRAMAKRIGTDHPVALALWSSGVHEARLLATMVGDPTALTKRQMESWARDFDSWDLVDGACINLFCRTPHAWSMAVEWSGRSQEYVKRAGFVLMAALAGHDKAASDTQFQSLLPVIEREAGDRRNFVRKAVNWALRQIGKRNAILNEAAIRTARRIQGSADRSARWVGTDTLRELTSGGVQARLKR